MTNNLQQLHNKHYQFPEYPNYYLSYQYDSKTNGWKFIGYRCVACGSSFKTTNVLPAHVKRCPQIAKKPKYKTEKITDVTVIRNKNGQKWEPFEMNQENSN